MPSMRYSGRAPGQWSEVKPLKATLKTKWSIMGCGFDYLTFGCFHIFRPLLLTCYIPMPLALMRKHHWPNLLESCFGGLIIRVWKGCLWHVGWISSICPPPCRRQWLGWPVISFGVHGGRSPLVSSASQARCSTNDSSCVVLENIQQFMHGLIVIKNSFIVFGLNY